MVREMRKLYTNGESAFWRWSVMPHLPVREEEERREMFFYPPMGSPHDNWLIVSIRGSIWIFSYFSLLLFLFEQVPLDCSLPGLLLHSCLLHYAHVVQMGFLARHHLGTYTHRGKKKQKVGQMFNRLIFLLEFLFFFFLKTGEGGVDGFP